MKQSPISSQTRLLMSLAGKGQVRSKEFKDKVSVGLSLALSTPAAKLKRSEESKRSWERRRVYKSFAYEI